MICHTHISIWRVLLTNFSYYLKDRLFPNILTPNLFRLTENVNGVAIVIQISKNKKLYKAPIIFVFWIESGVIGHVAIFMFGSLCLTIVTGYSFSWGGGGGLMLSNQVFECLELNGLWFVLLVFRYNAPYWAIMNMIRYKNWHDWLVNFVAQCTYSWLYKNTYTCIM